MERVERRVQRHVQLLIARGIRVACLVLATLSAPLGAAATGYTTYHFDNARDGWNNDETRLNQTTVRSLQRIGDYALDGEVDAQPLYARGIAYVATENDTLYAIDPRRGVRWQRHFGTAVSDRYVGNCRATAPVIGISGTPVIDSSRNTLYLVAFTVSDGRAAYTLHAVNAANGKEVRSVDISPYVRDTRAHRQRAGLLLSHGSIYVAFGGFCDHQAATTYGRVLAFDATTLAPRGAFVTTASPLCSGFHYGTIWGLGFAPAADSAGNVFLSTGNGCIDYNRLPNGGYSDAVLRLTPDLRLRDTHASLFAPCTAVDDNRHDQEVGSAGVLLAPDTQFAIAGGKNGVTYVLNRENLGGFRSHCPDRAVSEAETSWGLWGGPASWHSGNVTYVALAGTGPDGLRVYALAETGELKLRSETRERLFNGGQSAIVTSDPAATPRSLLLWTLTRPTTGTVYLRAYDALDVRRRLLSVAAGSWGNPYGYAGNSPTVADGYVFVATDKVLTVWTCRAQRRKS